MQRGRSPRIRRPSLAGLFCHVGEGGGPGALAASTVMASHQAREPEGAVGSGLHSLPKETRRTSQMFRDVRRARLAVRAPEYAK